MNRFAACVEYNGTAYSGWQRQGHMHNTVQENIELALSKVANENVVAQCAGRTDSGVHATMQIIHFDTSVIRSDRSWIRGTNTYLPDDISIKWVVPVDGDFHARFKAISREYHYVIYNNPLNSGAINRDRTTWEYRQLEVDLMQQAANHLLGEHDFTSYRATGCQSKTPVKTIHRIKIERREDFIILVIEANAFLHHMVRNIIGVLIPIGAGEQATDWSREVLDAKDRRVGGITAPPNGLYLTQVKYAPEFQLPETKSGIILLL